MFRLTLLLLLTLPLTVVAQVVNISDAVLRAAIENDLGKAAGDTITADDMATLDDFRAGNSNISDLTGLEYATNLEGLGLWNHSLSNISVLSGLTDLQSLDLSFNRIEDISPLSSLTNLIVLVLSDNSISDISVLSNLANLEGLWLSDNSISDISSVAGLTNLTGLGLGGNNVSDVSAVSGLTNLTLIDLSDNSISDLSPIVANAGLGEGDTVRVEGNPLSAESINTHIPTLQARGVEVEFGAPTVNIFFSPIRAANVGEIFRLNVVLDESFLLSGWSLNIAYTPPVYPSPVVEVIEIDTINRGAYISCDSGSSGSLGIDQTGLIELEFELDDESCYNIAGGALAELLVEAKAPGKVVFNLSNVVLRDQHGQPIPDIQTHPHEILVSPSRDLNGDGRIDILDLTLVSQYFGQYHPQADVNGDGTINILDLTAVAQCLEE